MTTPLTIFGVDFTSAPSSKKPITCACTKFDGESLFFDALQHWYSFPEFEKALLTEGPYVMAIDFPFGQARRFVSNSGLPVRWAEYVTCFSQLDRKQFRTFLEGYKRDRPFRDKRHKRNCDVLSRSQSPQTLYGTPVSLMFYEGSKRLLAAGVHLPHHTDGDPSRIVLEAYPGVATRSLIGKRSYKNDQKKKQTEEQYKARVDILTKLKGHLGRSLYGFNIHAPSRLAQDPGADELDALICAVQAAWGWSRRLSRFGAPKDFDRLEGWISDPALEKGL